MKVLVTGSAGMIGSHLVNSLLDAGYEVIGIDKKEIEFGKHYKHYAIDLGNNNLIKAVFDNYKIDRVIHLAALAHITNKKDYPKSLYRFINVDCSRNIFMMAHEYDVPVLFISTVDVYGFQKGVVTPNSECHPVTVYGKTKYEAELLLRDSGCVYTIFRLSPVYTPEIKRDIQKRYYLKYPNLAYQVGKGAQYEVLNVELAVKKIVDWCELDPNNETIIIKDAEPLYTSKCICLEKEKGRAKFVIKIPRWVVIFFYFVLSLFGKNKYTYLVYKVLFPYISV